MVNIASLWLPIVVSAVIVFVASSVLHMVLRYHRSDYRRLPDEDSILEALRKHKFERGTYYFPHMTDPAQMKHPEIIEKYRKGPVGSINIMPSAPPAMGKHLSMWFLYCLLIGLFVAYLGSRSLPAGIPYRSVFRFASTVAFLGYGMGNIMDSIWKGQTWSSTIKHMIDALIYSLLTGGVFGWLWPR